MSIATPERALVRIGDAAQATGLTQRAIRYYEELGLLRPAAHAAGTNRRYDEADLERLREIKRLRDVAGLSLGEVQEFLETEDVRQELRAEYFAAATARERLEVLDRAQPNLERRVHLLEGKLAALQELLDAERARLELIARLRRENEPACQTASTTEV